MKKILIVISLILPRLLFAQSENDRQAVNRVMLDYIEGFYEGDSSKIIRSVSPDVTKYGYWKDKKSGMYAGEAMSYKEMIQYTINVKAKNNLAKPDALKKITLFEIQDKIANGKVAAWWGIDYVMLEKVNDRWMIRMILWQGSDAK